MMFDCAKHQKEKEADKDSIVSERCWEEKYRGDSRRWLIRDGTTKGIGWSSMRDAFQEPEADMRQYVGKRRHLYRQQVTEEICEQIEAESKLPPPVEEYCTEYDGNYHIPGYDPDKVIPPDTDLYLKYPLYNSQPTTYYKFLLDQNPKGLTSIPGMTSVKDSKAPFRKYCGFAKDISEELDNAWL